MNEDFLPEILLICALFVEKTYYRAILNFTRTILFLFRVLFRSDFASSLIDKFIVNDKLQTFRGLASLMLQILFCCHISGCYFFLLGTRSREEEGVSWLDSIEFLDNTVYSKYINAFYFMVITMSTIGYGDIFPNTDREKLFMTFMSFFASGLFGYTINTLGTIFVEMD